ncbi:MAG: hypothetical protein M5R36_09535 [Deltaproteobacteria bacterium]|nr:hypothetical protein [Deltaproteobacteria bacterium]
MRFVYEAPREMFWEHLNRQASRVFEIFGNSLIHLGGGRYGCPENDGDASLGVIASSVRPILRLSRKPDGRNSVRMIWNDGDHGFNLSVTDVRLYNDEGEAVDRRTIDRVNTRFAEEPFLLSIGLTRAFKPEKFERAHHWLQVNNVHFKNSPIEMC